MWGGMVFCHQCLVPTAWEFFLSMGTHGEEGFQVAMETRVEDYIHLFLSILFAVSLAFQFPLILVGAALDSSASTGDLDGASTMDRSRIIECECLPLSPRCLESTFTGDSFDSLL